MWNWVVFELCGLSPYGEMCEVQLFTNMSVIS